MLLNISSDRIIFTREKEKIILPYGELEKNLPEFLYTHIGVNAKQTIVVVNGPWSFTNLRIATLALNTMNMLHNFPIIFSSISKISYLQHLYDVWWSPWRYCIMYIWQKKRYRVVDIASKEHITDESSSAIKKVHIDELSQYIHTLEDTWFVDELVAEWKETMNQIFGENEYRVFQYEVLPTLQIVWEKMIDPNYMISANIQ